jgi:hypothetical protein
MRGTVAKRLRKRAIRLWTEAVGEFPKIEKTNGQYIKRNSRHYQRDGQTMYSTATLVVLGHKRLVKNLKWLWKRGFRGPKSEQTAKHNAIQWSNAKA